MRINEDVRKCVAFLGHGIEDNFTAIATGFLIRHKDFIHFVTAKHVTVHDTFADAPFVIRLNTKGGGSGFLYFDHTEKEYTWYFHEDKTVDVAILPLSDMPLIGAGTDADAHAIPSSMFYDETNGQPDRIGEIGVGDETHTVGFFKLLQGEDKNTPIVHTGSIAMLPSDELISVEDWDKKNKKRKIKIEAYLVEQQSLSGLSGSPVFVTPTIGIKEFPTATRLVNIVVQYDQLFLMGLWHGAWYGEPAPILDVGSTNSIPVGMGIVIPVQKIKEVLDLPKLEQNRESFRRKEEGALLPRPDIHYEKNKESKGDALLAKMLNTPPKPRQ